MAKTPFPIILLALRARDHNPVHSFNFSYFPPFVRAHVYPLCDLSLSPFPVCSQVHASDENPLPPATANRPQSYSQATKTSPARSTLLRLTIKAMGRLARGSS